MNLRSFTFLILAVPVLMSSTRAETTFQMIPYKPDPPIAIDGKTGDWQAVSSAWECAPETTARAAWRGEALFLAVESKADRPQPVFLAVDNGLENGTHLLRFDPAATPPSITTILPEGAVTTDIHAAAERGEQAWALETSIPWATLGGLEARAGQVFRLSVSLTNGPLPENTAIPTVLLTGADGTLNDAPPLAQIFTEEQIPPGEKQSFTFEIPPCPEGLRAVLSLRARQDSKQVAGHAPVLRVRVNDVPAGGERMRNRPQRLKARGGDLYSMAAGERLAVYYSPDFTSPDTHPHYGPADPIQVCLIELDVTDMVKAGANTVELEQTEPSIAHTLILADGQVRFMLPPPPPRKKSGPPEGPLPRIAPALAPGVSFEAKPVNDNTIEVRVGDEAFLVESRFSTPAPGWVTGDNVWFKRERRLETTVEAVIVRDTFTNLTEEPLALMRRNEITLGERMEKLWLGGLERADKTGHSTSPANPTTFAATNAAGIGLLPLDDIARVHVVNQGDAGLVSLADNNLVLRPGATYTAEWAIIPAGKPDYWTFINASRRLYDANFTIEGAFVFLRAGHLTDVWTDAEIADFLRFKSAYYVCSSIGYYKDGRYAHGTSFQEVAHDNYINSFARWKNLVPGIKTMVYFHCFIDVTDEGPEHYADARLLQHDGAQACYGEPYDRIYVPTAENSYGPQIAKNVDVILDKIGADGVYWDEHEYSRFTYTYNEPWDGYTGDIDPKSMTVSRLKSSVTLLSEPWRLELARKILARGPLIGNGPPFTRAMAALKFPCFVETGSITHCVQAHLHSPIALGDHLTERSETDAYRVMLAALDFGCVYHWYNDLTVRPTHAHLVHYMYPITPVEINAGYIIGKERILTKVSGVFGWNDASEHEVHVFDDTGREVEGFNAPQVREDGKTWTELRLAEDWSAAIVRK
jgi:hypothetical protein